MDNIEEQLDLFESVKYRISDEGFDYCFSSYSNWQEIKDENFHNLRKQYLDTKKKLEEYIKERIQTLSNGII